MSSIEWRCAVAVFIGVVFDAIFFWRFLPYSARNSHLGVLVPLYLLPLLAFVAGIVLTIGLENRRRLIPIALVGGFCAANACLIIVDCWNDPTNHNLWPFEFLMIMVLTVPAFLGAGLGRIYERFRKAA
jgi:uncharacterized membrane protein YphA (DoxX/SURF4 family)